MLIDAPPTLLNTIIHKKHVSHFMAKTMNELAHRSPLIGNCGGSIPRPGLLSVKHQHVLHLIQTRSQEVTNRCGNK